jgi:hypothetical protein
MTTPILFVAPCPCPDLPARVAVVWSTPGPSGETFSGPFRNVAEAEAWILTLDFECIEVRTTGTDADTLYKTLHPTSRYVIRVRGGLFQVGEYRPDGTFRVGGTATTSIGAGRLRDCFVYRDRFTFPAPPETV